MKREQINSLKTEFSALSENESFGRSLVCAFVSQLDPTMDELADIRCAVSEAVTNAVVHAYEDQKERKNTIRISVILYNDRSLKITIADRGVGIADVEQARIPLFSTDTTGERSGMGFAIMESFMSELKVKSAPGKGTVVVMKKNLSHPTPQNDA